MSCVHDKWFRGVCRILGAPELAEDPRFATHALRAENGDAFHAELEQRLAARDATEWERDLNAEGIPAAVVRTPSCVSPSSATELSNDASDSRNRPPRMPTHTLPSRSS